MVLNKNTLFYNPEWQNRISNRINLVKLLDSIFDMDVPSVALSNYKKFSFYAKQLYPIRYKDIEENMSRTLHIKNTNKIKFNFVEEDDNIHFQVLANKYTIKIIREDGQKKIKMEMKGTGRQTNYIPQSYH